MKKYTFILLFLLPLFGLAATISGTIKDNKGNLLPYSSLLLKGTAKGTTANAVARYSLVVADGDYVLVCQHVGNKTVEKKVTVKGDVVLDFILEEQQYKLNDVVVKSGGEDPAYGIIRNTIKKRKYYENEFKSFACDVYIKGKLQLRNFPKKFMGEKVDFEDGDTSKKKILFLSETVAKYSVQDNNAKVEVISTRVSGNSSGFGLGNPQIISLYSNNINLGSGLNPRGFISPIASNALNYYKYHYEGSFYENGKEINRIKVIPRRKYEPLFSGYINIIENEWRLQSVNLLVLKENQMQLLDTLNLEQLYVPLNNTWVIKQQVIAPAGKFFAFDFFGSFLQVYENFDIAPQFKRKYFDNTLIKYFDSSNKKTKAYWDSIRPIPLLESEATDYRKKDSLELLKQTPRYLDSLDKIRNKLNVSDLLFVGQEFSNQKRKSSIKLDPIALGIGIYYNAVEGRVSRFSLDYEKRWTGRQRLNLVPTFRYGFSNRHLNAHLTGNYVFGKKYTNSINLSGGQRVFQLNNANPISEINNTLSTLFWQHSHMKIYEAAFVKASYSKGLGDGFSISANVQYQDRKPLNNTIDSLKGKALEPNYPQEIMATNFTRHQAFTGTINLTWRPGSKYIELPDRKINIGSKYPTFNFSATQAVNNIFGSAVDYSKWRFSINDDLNFKIGGRFNYHVAAGGFFYAKKTFVQDYHHFLGNQTALASRYLYSFQLIDYYQLSNTAANYGEAHVEYHLNGLLTNKIPVIRKLNWFLLVGGNALYINQNTHYYEAFFGVENIFKVFRIDFVKGFQMGGATTEGIRFSLPLLLNSGGKED